MKYYYRRTRRSESWSPRSRLIDNRVVFTGYRPYALRDFVAVHESGAAFKLCFWPSKRNSFVPVSACCHSDFAFRHGEDTLDNEGNIGPNIMATWEMELVGTDETEGAWVCYDCLKPVQEVSLNYNDARELEPNSSDKHERNRALTSSWLSAHGVDVLSSELEAVAILDELSDRFQRFELALKLIEADSFDLPVAVMGLYEAFADHVGIMEEDVSLATLLKSCVCCRGNMNVHGNVPIVVEC